MSRSAFYVVAAATVAAFTLFFVAIWISGESAAGKLVASGFTAMFAAVVSGILGAIENELDR